jgi:hypothetical protein
MRKTNWEIIRIEAPTAETLSPVIAIEGKAYNWQIRGMKSNLPAETRVEFSIPTLQNKTFQSEAVSVYALRQPEQPQIPQLFKGWKQWHSSIEVPREHTFNIKLMLPIEETEFPPNSFISLYYEYDND